MGYYSKRVAIVPSMHIPIVIICCAKVMLLIWSAPPFL